MTVLRPSDQLVNLSTVKGEGGSHISPYLEVPDIVSGCGAEISGKRALARLV